ncbi:hypothetical protein mRhiFer1_008574 [Rhinolophus ferrumequinum]|uniref:Endonuclease/exonuclease/phosphatase domain-containing protein n=1 Tax=Rhinolophus ferrumequinum TaxID=59479 RepID=A0A7J7UJI5_RHIFE|nr:hypothetical protein mRhiFer1_008574 [Rhinolophus ferrumequinum]
MVKGTIQQEDITVINIYAPNQGALKYTKQLLTELKGEIDQNTIILGDLNTSLTAMDRSSKRKINNEIAARNDTLDEMDIIDIYRALHPKTSDYTFFSSVHGTFSRIDHILGHKISLSKFKKIEIIPSIFSDHKALKLDINCKRKAGKTTNTWRLSNILLKNDQVKEEIRGEIKRYIETNENENTSYQNFGDTVKAVLRGQFISL